MDDTVKTIQDYLHRYLPELDKLGEEAAGIVGDKEGDFLSLGKAMQDVKRKCEACQETVINLTDTLSGDRMGDASSRMKQEFGTMRDIFSRGKFTEVIDELGSQKERISALVASEKEFKKIVKRLGMLAISTRIESARLGEEGRDFGALVVDVEGLSGKIVQDANKIKDSGGKLNEKLDTVLQETRDIDASRESLVQNLFSGVQKNLEQMENTRLESLTMAEEMRDTTKSVAEDVSAIVSSMQFQDITRQQLEHVQYVLRNSGEEVSSSLASDPDEDTYKELLAYVGDVCQLQASQMRNSHNELDKAFSVLRDKFTSIEQQIQNIAERIPSGQEESEKGSQDRSMVSRIVAGLQQIAKDIRLTGDQNKRITSLMGEMHENMSEIEGFVEEIEEVGSEVELLALNASVKAAHTGENGRALGVIAVSIQQLSYEARDQGSSIVDILQKSLQASTQMTENTKKAFDLQEISEVDERLHSLMSDMQKMDKQAGGLQADIYNYTREMLELIQTVLQVLDRSREILSDLEKIYGKLEEISSSTKKIVSSGIEKDNPRLQRLLSQYTMESERMVHNMLSGLERIGEEPAEEHEGGEGEEDWDNVELF